MGYNGRDTRTCNDELAAGLSYMGFVKQCRQASLGFYFIVWSRILVKKREEEKKRKEKEKEEEKKRKGGKG
jgi:hypothetical protein